MSESQINDAGSDVESTSAVDKFGHLLRFPEEIQPVWIELTDEQKERRKVLPPIAIQLKCHRILFHAMPFHHIASHRITSRRTTSNHTSWCLVARLLASTFPGSRKAETHSRNVVLIDTSNVSFDSGFC